MNQNRPNRGRGPQPAERRNFGDETVQREERNKKLVIAEKIRAKKSQPSGTSPETESEKHGLIEKGKAWVSKYFRGMTKSERGNIKVTLRPDIDAQIYSLYITRLSAWIIDFKTEPKTKLASQQMLRPLINLLMGIKLLHANTQQNRATMVEYRGIEFCELNVPKRMASLINNLGKSDAMYENVIRIRSQNLYAKTCFFKAIIDYFGSDPTLYNRNITGHANITFNLLNKFRNDNLKFGTELRMYDLTVDGAKYVNQFGKAAIEWINKYEFSRIESGTELFRFRLPYLDPDKLDDMTLILEWSAKARTVFKSLDIDEDIYSKVVTAAWLGYMPLHWLKNRKKNFEQIDSRFTGTLYEGLKPLDALNIWDLNCMDDYFSNDDLINNTILLIEEYRERVTPLYNRIYNTTKFVPTDYGSASQIVHGHVMENKYVEDIIEPIPVVGKKTSAKSYIKMMEHEALIGTMLNLANRVDFSNNYDITYEGRTSEIQLDYIISDFKDT